MKVELFPADSGGCGAFRMRYPAEALAAQGYDVHVHDKRPRVWWRQDERGELEVGKLDGIDGDVVVFQRPTDQSISKVMRGLQRFGLKVVIDMDDDLRAVSPSNINYPYLQPSTSPKSNWTHAVRACSMADLVTATTPALLERYAPHGRGALLPNCVPESWLSIEQTPRDPDRVTFGWTGDVDTHPFDLQATRGAVGQIVRETGGRFYVVGSGRGVRQALGLDDEPDATGWQRPIETYFARIGAMDIGIVPLEDSKFNRAKSWLKFLEMSAAGVPVVASATPANLAFEAEGAGVCVRKASQWRGALRKLALDASWRAELAARGRETAAAWTYERRAKDVVGRLVKRRVTGRTVRGRPTVCSRIASRPTRGRRRRRSRRGSCGRPPGARSIGSSCLPSPPWSRPFGATLESPPFAAQVTPAGRKPLAGIPTGQRCSGGPRRASWRLRRGSAGAKLPGQTHERPRRR